MIQTEVLTKTRARASASVEMNVKSLHRVSVANEQSEARRLMYYRRRLALAAPLTWLRISPRSLTLALGFGQHSKCRMAGHDCCGKNLLKKARFCQLPRKRRALPRLLSLTPPASTPIRQRTFHLLTTRSHGPPCYCQELCALIARK